MCHNLIIKLLRLLKIGIKCLNETTEEVEDIKRPHSETHQRTSPSLNTQYS